MTDAAHQRRLTWFGTSIVTGELRTLIPLDISRNTKLSEHRMSVPPAYPNCGKNIKTGLNVLVQCPELSRLIVNSEHVLSYLGRVQLPVEFMIKIVPPHGL